MASINFNPFGEYWFKKPPNPLPPLNLLSFIESNLSKNPQTPNFASINSSNFFKKPQKPNQQSDKPGKYKEMLDQFFWECEAQPDHRHTPKVERILNEDPLFDKKENPNEEEIKENAKWWEEFRNSPVVQFLSHAEDIADKINELELKANENPYRDEDRKLWKALPHVIGLDGRPMPRKAIKSRKESDDKFWDFARQFFFGLWGFRQRPYPPGRPIDVAQAIGYKRLEKRYYDFIMRSGGWYYKDRLGRTRGPLELITLKTAWGGGIIDKDTFIWGDDMDEWAPIHMVYGLERAIATWEGIHFGSDSLVSIMGTGNYPFGGLYEWISGRGVPPGKRFKSNGSDYMSQSLDPLHTVDILKKWDWTADVRLGAAATAFIHKLQKGIPPWVPLKGHEKKTYKQLQEEAIESKKRDLAVLEANDGMWPGVRTPSHALFLWASGSELTTTLEADHMPNKYIPKDLRLQLAKAIPGLRPWEVLSVEQAMDQITYDGEWYREPLGSYTTGPPYIRHWNKDVKRMFRIFFNLSTRVYSKLDRTIPGFSTVMDKVLADSAARDARRKDKRAAEKRAEAEKALGGRLQNDP